MKIKEPNNYGYSRKTEVILFASELTISTCWDQLNNFIDSIIYEITRFLCKANLLKLFWFGGNKEKLSFFEIDLAVVGI